MIEKNIEIRRLPAARGLEWLASAFTMFSQKPGVWIAIGLIFMAISLTLSLVPGISLFGTLLTTPLLGGLMLACCRQRENKAIGIESLFSGFATAGSKLVLLGLLYLLGSLIISLLILVPALSAGALQLIEDDLSIATPSMDEMNTILLLLLLMMAALVPLLMAYFFAPALVAVARLEPLTAMRLSFIGCLRNMLPFLLYGLVALIMMIVAALPLMLGFLILTPVLICSMYLAFEDVFVPIDSTPTVDTSDSPTENSP